jgi:hypothetical protein
MNIRCTICGLLMLLVTAVPALGQVAGRVAGPGLQGKHQLSLHIGMLNWSSVEADVSPASIETDTRISGFLGSLNYAYWLGEDLTLTLSAGGTGVGVSADIAAGEVRSETDAVGFILVGVAYYPAAVAFSDNVHGFVAGSLGSYVGEATNTNVVPGVVRVEDVRETAFGGRLAVGVSWFATGRLVLGGNLGYHVMTDFERSIGGAENYSGPEVSASIGVLLGRGKSARD